VLHGDASGDGFVGQSDLDIVLEHWGQTVPPGDPWSGDLSGDGFVGQADLDTVLANWGQSLPGGGEAMGGMPGDGGDGGSDEALTGSDLLASLDEDILPEALDALLESLERYGLLTSEA